jgi:Universal stress protein family
MYACVVLQLRERVSRKERRLHVFQHVLVAVDGSADAELARLQAVDLARAEDARITLLTAVQPPPPTLYASASSAVLLTDVAEAARLHHSPVPVLIMRAAPNA